MSDETHYTEEQMDLSSVPQSPSHGEEPAGELSMDQEHEPHSAEGEAQTYDVDASAHPAAEVSEQPAEISLGNSNVAATVADDNEATIATVQVPSMADAPLDHVADVEEIVATVPVPVVASPMRVEEVTPALEQPPLPVFSIPASALPSTRRRRARPWWLAGIAVLALLAVSAGFLSSGPAGALGFGWRLGGASTATTTAEPTGTATAAPTTTPEAPNAARNLAMGCANGRPSAFGFRAKTVWDAPAGSHTVPEVALTFDDGPTPYTTPKFLDYLEQTHTPATFFVEGQYVHLWPSLVRREWNDGFAIGEHSWDHPMFTRIPDSAMSHQIGDTDAAVHAAIGADACIWFWRPPYGEFDAHVGSFVMGQYHQTVIGWDIDSLDYNRPGPQAIANTVLSHVHPGSIVLMHDGPALREQTLAALPLILAGLQARGLKLVTLPTLFADEGFPGVSQTPTAPSDAADQR